MISDGTLEKFLKNEIDLKVEENTDGITIKSYEITNINEIKQEIKNTSDENSIDIKFNITYSNNRTNTKLTKSCTLKIIASAGSAIKKNYNRYIDNEKTLKKGTKWQKGTTGRKELDNIMNKNIKDVPSYNVTK